MLYSRTADKLCELGRFGQKTGAGWYDYQEGKRDAIPSRLVEDMVVEHRKSLGITPRKISDEEIVQRLVFALVNEGARILEEGIATRPGDIDIIWIYGYGWPVWRGGPMHYADQIGLSQLRDRLSDYAARLGDATLAPAALLDRLATESRGFASVGTKTAA